MIGDVLGKKPVFRSFDPGIATYEFWLELGIILLGVRFILADVMKLGAKLTALLAIGSSVCGVSAIIATQGAIAADEDDSAFAIASILIIGAISLFAFPLIGHALHMSDHLFGVWAGLAIDNTAEVAAAGALYSDEAQKVAVLVKTARNATIGFVVLFAAIYFASRGGRAVVGSKAAFVWEKLPKFVLGFLAFSIAASREGALLFSPFSVLSG